MTRNTAITIGKFDGMHLGHAALIEKIVAQRKNNLNPLVLTFDVSPRIALNKAPKQAKFLFTRLERDKIISSLGVEYIHEMAFTKEMIEMEPEEFIKMLIDEFGMKYLCVGEDFRFGHKGRGDVGMLKSMSKDLCFEFESVKKIKDENGDIISSTSIRDDITHGRLETANKKLGYEFFLLGDITQGNHIGRTLGMPTINIRPDSFKLTVPAGVYVSVTTIGDESYPGVTNVGFRPTIKEDHKELLVETHLLNFDGDLYGNTAKVSFRHFLREEKKFDSLEELKKQIEADTISALAFFK